MRTGLAVPCVSKTERSRKPDEGALLGGATLRFKGAAIASVTSAIDRALARFFFFVLLRLKPTVVTVR